jgi:hypothetical protein
MTACGLRQSENTRLITKIIFTTNNSTNSVIFYETFRSLLQLEDVKKRLKNPKFSLFTPRRHVKGTEAQILSFLNSALHGNEWLTSRPDRFTLKDHRNPLNERLGGPQSQLGRSGEERNMLPLPGIELRTVQPIVCCHICNCSYENVILKLLREISCSRCRSG